MAKCCLELSWGREVSESSSPAVVGQVATTAQAQFCEESNRYKCIRNNSAQKPGGGAEEMIDGIRWDLNRTLIMSAMCERLEKS